MAYLFFQTLFVNGTDLFQKYDRILWKGIQGGRKGNMGGQFCFIHLRSDGGADDGGAMLISDIILHDKDRTDAALFAA